jgi:hypothetical protein
MKYIILLLVIFSIFVLFNSSIKEGNQTLSGIATKDAINTAKDSGFDSGFYETGNVMGPDDISDELKDKIDYTKNTNNLDVEYHDPPEVITKNEGIEFSSVWVYDPIQKKKIAIERPAMQSNFTYYEPDTYKYGAATYVPSYTDSVLLSRSNNYIGDYIFNNEYEKDKAKQEKKLIAKGNVALLKKADAEKNK